MSITPRNNRDLNQGLLHIWSKLCDLYLSGWWVIARTSKCLPHTRTDGRTHRQTDAGIDNTRRPKLASGNKWVNIGEIKRYIHKRYICRSLRQALICTVRHSYALYSIAYAHTHCPVSVIASANSGVAWGWRCVSVSIIPKQVSSIP